jgi:hypothetical protein
MPLSEHEQRLLDQIERALYAEDPKFASNVRGARMRSPSRRRRLQGIAVFVLGLVLLVVGAAVMRLWVAGVPVVSVLGFLVMFTGAAVAIFARGGGRDTAAGQRSGPPPSSGGKSGLAQRMEERFRRRFEER